MPKPEHWSLRAGDAASATLAIPADAQRSRHFEIACAISVALPADASAASDTGAWHQITVQANGAAQWRRRVPTHNPGADDGLDYRFSRTVPVGQTLRVTVAVACHGARRRSLVIEADEV